MGVAVVTTESFQSGSTIGQYRIINRIGAGGMGEVYLAEDTKLGREVALKVLPDAFVHDAERRMRLEREARLLASLNHPNVATLHGFQEAGHRAILEMELVPGQTLAERLKAAPLKPREALPIFNQIAAGLEAAHQRGIIHRDLKPANIKLLPDGRVKVLDFGVGKVFESQKDVDDLTISVSARGTSAGWIVGTAQYMSPEQARGEALDPRTDIWSFGCVLFEALTGDAPFNKDTAAETFASILKDEPDWEALAHSPASVQRLVRNCLQKDPTTRLRNIGDARLEIEEAITATKRAPAALPRVLRNYRPTLMMAAGAVLLVTMTLAASRYFGGATSTASLPQIRVAIPVAGGQRFATGPARVLAISPDGSRLVYAAAVPGSRTQLFLRPIDRFESEPIAGTDGATAPFFSPDGEWVGFHSGGALRKVSLAGGSPLTIADVPSLAGATWGDDNSILFATLAGDGIWRVADSGGTPQQLTRPDAAKNETQHHDPQLLPGSKTALITVTAGHQSHPAVLNIESAQWQVLPQITARGGARFVPPGHLIYEQSGGLVAVAFDAARGELRGSPVPLRERIETSANGAAQFAVSGNGSLVYVPGKTARPARSLIVVDRDGRAQPLHNVRASYAHPRLSPDGRWVAVSVDSDSGSDVWVYDLQRGTRTRLTSDGASGFPVWTPDGKSVTYHSATSDQWTLFSRPADASGPAQPLLTLGRPERSAAPGMAMLLPGTLPSLSGTNPQFPMSWSGDGKALAFIESKPSAERDIWVVEPGSDPSPFLVTPFDESAPAFSPDGKFLAYVSDESGRPEVYVQPYPGPGGRWLISTDGGTDPQWSAGGRELFYRSGRDVLAVTVQTSPAFTAGVPARIFEARFDGSDAARNFDASRDGRRLVTVRSDEAEAPLQFHAVFNWFAEIQRRTVAPQ
jgi:eukaryotic-like serine/threonine-protein kinase